MKNFTAITIGYEHNKKSLNVIRYGRVTYSREFSARNSTDLSRREVVYATCINIRQIYLTYTINDVIFAYFVFDGG